MKNRINFLKINTLINLVLFFYFCFVHRKTNKANKDYNLRRESLKIQSPTQQKASQEPENQDLMIGHVLR